MLNLDTSKIFYDKRNLVRKTLKVDTNILKKKYSNFNFFILSYEGILSMNGLIARILRNGKRTVSEKFVRFLFFRLRSLDTLSLFSKFFIMFYPFRITLGTASWRIGRQQYQIPFVKNLFFEVTNSMRFIYKIISIRFSSISGLFARFFHAFGVFFSEPFESTFRQIYLDRFEEISDNLFFLRYLKRFRRSYRILYLRENLVN